MFIHRFMEIEQLANEERDKERNGGGGGSASTELDLYLNTLISYYIMGGVVGANASGVRLVNHVVGRVFMQETTTALDVRNTHSQRGDTST